MARMDEKPRRRWFRFRLISLFALVAVGPIFWNPFPKLSKSNIHRIKFGMTEAEVADLVGKARPRRCK
jgi:hypothetical protein